MGKEFTLAIAEQRTHVVPVRRTNWRVYFARTWPLYAMLVLPLIQLALFHYYPMYGVIVAFQNFNPGLGFIRSPWVGFANFRYLFSNPDFKTVLWNSFFIAIAKLISLQVLSVGLAHFLSWIVLGGILVDLLSSNGLLNRSLGMLGIAPILFLGSNNWFRPV